MTTTERLRTSLFWLVTANVCVISISIAASSLLLGATLLVLLSLFALERRWVLSRTPLDAAFLAYIIAEFISAALSDHPADALKNAKRLLLISIVYAVLIGFRNRTQLLRGIMYLSGSVALLSLAEIVLYYTQGTERLYVFQHYMTTGGLKMIVGLMLIPFLLDEGTEKRHRQFYAAAFIPVIAALVLTNTRSAWLGFVTGILVMSILHYRRLFLILAAAILLFFQFGPEQQVARAKSIVDLNNPTNVGRFNMWSTGLRMWQDRPLFGFGDIDLYQTYLTYRTPTGDEPAGHLHNNYVHLLVTLGAVGLAVVLFLFARILWTQFVTVRRTIADPLLRNIALGSIAVFCGFLVNGMFEWNFGDHEIMVFVWFSVGLCLTAATMLQGEQR